MTVASRNPPLLFQVTSCSAYSGCPFASDEYGCQHPEVSSGDGCDMGPIPATCPLRDRAIMVGLAAVEGGKAAAGFCHSTPVCSEPAVLDVQEGDAEVPRREVKEDEQ